MIESMCLTCHGPIAVQGVQKRKSVLPLYCKGDGGNCRAVAYRMRGGYPLPAKYASLRALHAFRRQMQAVQARVGAVLDAGGWLEVG